MPTPLEYRIEYTFQNADLLQLALTHASWGHEQGQKLPHNERLEFLGDSVLQLAVSQMLYGVYPEMPEGSLTKIRSHLVNRTALHSIATALELGNHLILGVAEESQGGRKRPSNLANSVEALLGAIYLDGGFPPVLAFVDRHIRPRLSDVQDNPEPHNAKGQLQEKLHLLGKQAVYRILSEEGPPHDRRFHAVVEIAGTVRGSGSGQTKKEAETRAAQAALTHWQEETTHP